MSELSLSQDYLKACFTYDPEFGVLTWKNRPREHFNCNQGWKMWNARYAGKIAGCGGGSHGYLSVGIRNKMHLNHRVIWCWMTGEWPSDQIDHIDHIKQNNLWHNLREADNQTNCKNMPILSTNTSGVTGVSWDKAKQKYQAYITVNDRKLSLGHYDAFKAAVASRKAAEALYGFHRNHGS